MENMKLLKLEDLENVCGGFRRYGPVLPGMGFPKFPDKKEDEPKLILFFSIFIPIQWAYVPLTSF